ncbi:DUF5680 domain-containing protein [Mesorhizobium sp. B2-3-4]|uniref:DUF5680 domain-containing protein n=1 Tax=Mesorhizobium sp. B2-3-4 TaxID=2589959 RepID=UPI00112BD6F6|nr:DUF5680 domain-containing protein [Mesorhizobium sp. B2-3-4]TPM38485.1 hypothetical protein FJ967_11200 [Mesorhizobium sp. B2-3-4]
MDGLETFIVEAKSATYVGGGSPSPSCRTGSHDICYKRGAWRYLDSYFGGTDFLGQELVWKNDDPIWAMNYYGRVLEPELIDATAAGAVIREALSALYGLGRFLGVFEYTVRQYRYVDNSNESVEGFRGIERIYVEDREVYRLEYHGGLIRP